MRRIGRIVLFAILPPLGGVLFYSMPPLGWWGDGYFIVMAAVALGYFAGRALMHRWRRDADGWPVIGVAATLAAIAAWWILPVSAVAVVGHWARSACGVLVGAGLALLISSPHDNRRRPAGRSSSGGQLEGREHI